MANIKSIGGNPIVVGMDGLTDDAKATLRANRPSATLSGSIVTADDAAPTTPIDTTIYGQSTQGGTPTPSSPVPIVSVEGDSEGNISLWAHGFNWWDEQWETGTIDATTGENSSATEAWRTKNYIPVLPSTTYYAKGTKVGSTDGWLRMRYYDSAKTYIGSTDANGNTTKVDSTFVTPANARYIRFAPQNTQVVDKQVCINLSGPRNGEYVPYVGSTTPIDLDGHELRSLPDGTRDELTVDAEGHVTLVQRVGVVTLDGSGSFTAVTQPSGGVGTRFAAADRFPDIDVSKGSLSYVEGVTLTHGITTGDALAISSWEPGDSCIGKGTKTLYLVLPASVGSTVESGNTWLQSNPVTVDYPLATPVTHDLGTVPLVPLVGPDLTAQTVPTAPLALTYERDATIVLDRLTAMWGNVAPVEGDTASASYSVGSYLMHGGQLCKVTTAIATGEAISIGTNVTATTVMAEVIALTQ